MDRGGEGERIEILNHYKKIKHHANSNKVARAIEKKNE